MTTPISPDSNHLNRQLRRPNRSVLRNRLAKAAMSEVLGTCDNHATQRLVELCRRWAHPDMGMLITGNVMIDRRAVGEPGNVVIEDESLSVRHSVPCRHGVHFFEMPR